MLTLTGSNSASALASTPARYIIGDERDRWATSAGTEGDPWALAEARQATFYNAKAVEVSTPTIKGNSNIETSFYQGTQERWCHRCPECGEYSEIVFDNIHFDPEVKRIRGKKSWSLKSGVSWSCPACGCLIPEDTMRKQPAKWIADNPDAYKKGVRSFWLNAFSSPWTPWEKIVLKFLDAKDDPQRLKVVYNTLLGQLWEDRGDLEDEDTMLARREDYGTRSDGTPVELPDGVLVLTCGVDTQDNRLEYEVVGHGKYGETWGVVKGYAALLDLVTDICKRNGIKRLVWSTSKNDRVNHLNGCNMTVHRDYANKSCPGDYLYNRHGQIAAEVNKRLGITDAGGSTGGQTSGSTETGLKVGDVVNFKGTQHYTSAAAKDAKTCKPGKATITAIAAGKAHPYHLKAVSGGGSTVYGWVNAADISTGSAGTATSYRVRTTADVLNIRKGPGTNYGVAGQIKGKGIYTIVAEAAGPGATKWGKLKSGAGWISLDYVTKL